MLFSLAGHQFHKQVVITYIAIKMVYLLLFVCYYMFAASTAIGSWQRQEQNSTWKIQLARLSVDTQITMETPDADSVTGCAFHCSSTMGVDAWSLYFLPETRTCHCNSALDANPEDENVAQLYYGTAKTLYKREVSGQDTRDTAWPKDCLTLHQMGYLEDGVYEIIPKGGAATTTWCDMTNGGWTVFQTRRDGSENFTRGWADYVNGFGDRTGEYWLGLENIHYLTKNESDLQIYLEAFPGVSPPSLTANYSSFTVGDGAAEYVIHMGGYSGDACGDSMAVHEGMRFSTWDNDNDGWSDGNCASEIRGGWWFYFCMNVMLNGRYHQNGAFSPITNPGGGLHWFQCWNNQHSLKSTSMRVRRHA